MIQKVKVVHTCPIRKGGGRVLSVKTDKGEFLTPNRPVSSTEVNYKAAVGCDDPYDNQILEFVGIFNEQYLMGLHTKNGPFGNRRRKIARMARDYGDIDAMFHMQPQWGRRNLVYTEKDIKFLVELQYRANLEFIRIPDKSPNSKPEDFEEVVLGYAGLVKDQFKLEPVPLLDLAMDPDTFRRKLSIIVRNKTDTFKMVAFQHRSFEQAPANYGYIWDYRDEDIWFHLSGVNRLLPANHWTTAGLHYPQRFGIDTCARLTQQVPVIVPPKPLMKVKRFDSGTLGIIPLEEHSQRYGDNLACKCPVCVGKTLPDYVDTYKLDHRGIENSGTLDKWNKVHEVFASTSEFDTGRDAIREDRLREYFLTKDKYKGLKL